MKKLLILLFAVVACQPVKESQEEFVTLKVFEMPATELEFESVRYVPLSSGSDHLLGNQLLTRFYNEEIYVLDIGSLKSILRFTAAGDFLNLIGKEGRGAEEYTGAEDFAKYGDTITILAGYGTESRFIRYLTDGTYVGTTTIDVLARSFEKIPSGYIVYTGTSPEFTHRFYTLDNNGQIRDPYLENDTKWEFAMTDETFSEYRSDVYIHEALYHTLYLYREGKLQQTFLLDLSKYSIPREFYSKGLMEAFPALQKQGFGSIRNYFENKRYSVFDVVLQKEGKEPEVFQFVYDKKRKDLLQHSFVGKEENNEIFQHLIGLTDKDELVYMIYPVEVIDNIETLKGFETSKESNLEALTEMDNPIIAFCKFAR